MQDMRALRKLPANSIESGSSYFWLDDAGILVIVNKPVAVHTEADALTDVAIAMDISAGTPRPLLVDISDVKSMSRDAREIYANVSSEERVRAVALVTRSAISRILGNFFVSFNKPSVPIKIFSDADTARKWLLTFI